MSQCPCGTGNNYLDCCDIFISGRELPSSPEALMRSRYTAYNQIKIDYIAKTMKSPAADNFNAEATREWAKKITWINLEIIKSTSNASIGFVEFIAHYFCNRKKYFLHENSEFKFENGQWYYVNGTQYNKKLNIGSTVKIGRNDICPCGSNKKYKKCCENL